jgi:hypothetical protein
MIKARTPSRLGSSSSQAGPAQRRRAVCALASGLLALCAALALAAPAVPVATGTGPLMRRGARGRRSALPR